MTAVRRPYIAPLRALGSTDPTRRVARPEPAPQPSGWRESAHHDGTSTWTWSDVDGAPVVSVLVSPLGVAPVVVRRPDAYWADIGLVGRVGAAMAELARRIGQGA